jgi:ABC-type branched-subunit amino acid transport system permease subunit
LEVKHSLGAFDPSEPSRYKLLAALVSCTLSGFAGGLWVFNHGFVAL